MYQFIIVLFSVVILGYLLERILISVLGYSIFRFITAPGILIHEVSHAIFIYLFGGKIKTFKIFKIDGGEVTYTKPYFPLISQPIISMAPILGCSIALYISGIILGFNFSNIDLSFNFKNLLTVFDFFQLNLNSIIFLYLVLSFTSAMAPSKKDITNAMSGLILLILIFIAIYYFLPYTNTLFLKMSFIYLVGLYMVIIALIISFLFWLIKTLSEKYILQK